MGREPGKARFDRLVSNYCYIPNTLATKAMGNWEAKMVRNQGAA